MKKNKRSNPSSSNISTTSSSSTPANNQTPSMNDVADSPSSASSRGTKKSSTNNLFEQLEEVVNNNSASSDCGTPCSSPIIKDPYEFRIKTEDNDSDINDNAKKPRIDNQKINQSKNTDSEQMLCSDQPQGVNSKCNTNTTSYSSSKGMTHQGKRIGKDRKKSIGINTYCPPVSIPISSADLSSDEKLCSPGTEIQLTGTVWLETTAGMLVINVTWRGRSYIGSLLDTSKHKFSPPIPKEHRPNNQVYSQHTNSPAKGFRSKKRYNIPYRIPVGRPNGKRKNAQNKLQTNPVKRSTNRNISESSSSVDDASSIDDNNERLVCPINDCGQKFSSMSAMHKHLPTHSSDDNVKETSDSAQKTEDNTLIPCESTKESVSAEKTQPSDVKSNFFSISSVHQPPPRASSVLPLSKGTVDVESVKDRWVRHETRTPSPPRLAMAHSPTPYSSNHQTSTPNLNRQNNHNPLNLPSSQQVQTLPSNGNVTHQPYNFSTQLKPSPSTSNDEQIKLFERFRNQLASNNSFGKKSPPKLMPEVNLNSDNNGIMGHSFSSNHRPQQQHQQPFHAPLNLASESKSVAKENKSLNTLITESLMAAAAGKLNQTPQRNHSPPTKQKHQQQSSFNIPFGNSENFTKSSNSSDLFAAVMSKMLAGATGSTIQTTIPPSTTTSGVNSFSTSSLTKSSSLPVSSSSINNNNPLVNSQFDTKSLSSAAYLMNLPGLLSSTTNHQMR